MHQSYLLILNRERTEEMKTALRYLSFAINVSFCFITIFCGIVTAGDQKIAGEFFGSWIEYKEGKPADSLVITTNGLIWKRTDSFNEGEESFKLKDLKLSNGGKIINLSSKQAYAKEFFSGEKHSALSNVTIKRQDDNIVLAIDETKVQRGNAIITSPAEIHIFKRADR